STVPSARAARSGLPDAEPVVRGAASLATRRATATELGPGAGHAIDGTVFPEAHARCPARGAARRGAQPVLTFRRPHQRPHLSGTPADRRGPRCAAARPVARARPADF